jgi:putative ABC transport system substrate-binding protein
MVALPSATGVSPFPSILTSYLRRDPLVILLDIFTNSYASNIVALATRSKLPSMYQFRGPVAAGGLISYGPSPRANFERAAYYVDRILKGAKPADLPVEQPMRFDFVINVRTAQALGLTIPQRVLLQATEVIQ